MCINAFKVYKCGLITLIAEYVVHSICIWSRKFWVPSIETFNQNAPSSQSSNAETAELHKTSARCIKIKWNSSNILFISTSLCLCLNKFKQYTQYYPTSFCGHNTSELSLKNTAFYVFLLTGIANNWHVHLGFLTCILECGQLRCDVIPSSNIWLLS